MRASLAASQVPSGSGGPDGVRRLVVLSYHFPPDGAVGGLRWSGLTKYLARLGWSCWVVTAASPAGTEVANGVTVESCPRRRTLNDVYRWLRLRPGLQRVGRGPNEPFGEPLEQAALGWVARMRLEAAMLLSVPDHGRGWILRAAARARRLIAAVQPDAVVSSGPPHSTHLAAWLATRGRRTRWLVDLRDPWAGPIAATWRSSPAYQSLLSRWLSMRLERLVIPSANGVICTTRDFAAALRASYPGVSVEWVPNAADRELLPARSPDPFPGLGIVYAGTLYGTYDLGPVLRALRRFLDRHPPAAAQGTKLRIAGHIEPHHERALRLEVTARGLERFVESAGVLSREAALNLVARSRLAIVLAHRSEWQVPAKLYELVAMEIPTLVVAPGESPAVREAVRLGATVAAPDDVAAIERLMEALWLGRMSAPRDPNVEVLVDYRDRAARVSRVLAGMDGTAQPE